ncbi:hypothetical protein KIN20_013728 [Parelaphostrongylus tenuis]|uniref:Uncharacterized protein n=1 Tax=Parelaphostrongylus tenuis TaxID=148309 RepID=A0AAD5MWJ0_PARTN|nr:hypothetical protein KIN20_013728 [Parelaphostrongylus tenuis]
MVALKGWGRTIPSLSRQFLDEEDRNPEQILSLDAVKIDQILHCAYQFVIKNVLSAIMVAVRNVKNSETSA